VFPFKEIRPQKVEKKMEGGSGEEVKCQTENRVGKIGGRRREEKRIGPGNVKEKERWRMRREEGRSDEERRL
jgi:hypothetical protein